MENQSLRTKTESYSSGGNVPGMVPIELCLVVVDFVVVGCEVYVVGGYVDGFPPELPPPPPPGISVAQQTTTAINNVT